MRSFLPLLPLVLIGSAAFAQAPTKVEDEWQDFLDTPVTVAGKKAQKISDAPAIVSVITAEELRNQGVTTLYEALSLLPGINVVETFYGYPNVNFRGNLQSNYNNKWIFMLNDHPMFEPVTGNSHLEYVPLSQVKRIEVLRGPGSAVYGTNAFTGVVKVVTYDGTEGDTFQASIKGGSSDTYGGDGRYTASLGKLKVVAGGSATHGDGYAYKVEQDEDGRKGQLLNPNNLYNAMLGLYYGDLKINMGAFQNTKGKFGLIPSMVSTGNRELRGLYADASYTWHANEDLDISAYGYFDDLKKEELIAWYPPVYTVQQAGVGGAEDQFYQGTKSGFNVQATYAFNQDWRLIGGGFGEFQESTPYLFLSHETGAFSIFKTSAYYTDKEMDNKGGYVQVDGRLHEQLGMVAGLRYTKNSVYGDSTAPSFGLVYNPNSKLSFKALYGKGSRDPNFFEFYVETFNVVYGNLNLKPEELQSYELAADYTFGKNNLRVNAYWFDTKDLIERSLLLPPNSAFGNTKETQQYGNSAGQKLTGLEAELKGSFHPAEKHFVNLSYQKGKVKDTDRDVMFIPKVLANLGMNWTLQNKITVSPYLQYVGKCQGNLIAAKGNLPVDVKSYLLANLNLEYQFKPFWVGMTVRNLFDKTYASPEYIRRRIAEIPGGPERAIHFQLGFRH